MQDYTELQSKAETQTQTLLDNADTHKIQVKGYGDSRRPGTN